MGRLGRLAYAEHLISTPDQVGWKQMCHIIKETYRAYCPNVYTVVSIPYPVRQCYNCPPA